jgi:hypothetical protein
MFKLKEAQNISLPTILKKYCKLHCLVEFVEGIPLCVLMILFCKNINISEQYNNYITNTYISAAQH